MKMLSLSADPSKKQLVAAIVGPSIGCGVCLALALSALDKHYPPTQLQLFAVAMDLLLSGMALYIAITSCRKVMKLLP
jgi:hypothetical protein